MVDTSLLDALFANDPYPTLLEWAVWIGSGSPEVTRKNDSRGANCHPADSTRVYTAEEWEFMRALQRYKKERRRPFPTWSEVLRVAQSLGYRKVEPSTFDDLLLNGVEYLEDSVTDERSWKKRESKT